MGENFCMVSLLTINETLEMEWILQSYTKKSKQVQSS